MAFQDSAFANTLIFVIEGLQKYVRYSSEEDRLRSWEECFLEYRLLDVLYVQYIAVRLMYNYNSPSRKVGTRTLAT
jgi:hypothetical protein